MLRDDIYEYAVDHKHGETEGKKIRKKIYLVTIILSVITTVEVILGMYIKNDGSLTWQSIKTLFILLTVVKAGYIVMVFMHMNDEHRHLRKLILFSYYLFILDLTILLLHEGWVYGHVLQTYGAY